MQGLDGDAAGFGIEEELNDVDLGEMGIDYYWAKLKNATFGNTNESLVGRPALHGNVSLKCHVLSDIDDDTFVDTLRVIFFYIEGMEGVEGEDALGVNRKA